MSDCLKINPIQLRNEKGKHNMFSFSSMEGTSPDDSFSPRTIFSRMSDEETEKSILKAENFNVDLLLLNTFLL